MVLGLVRRVAVLLSKAGIVKTIQGRDAQASPNFAYLAYHDVRFSALATQAEQHFAGDLTITLYGQSCPRKSWLPRPRKTQRSGKPSQQRPAMPSSWMKRRRRTRAMSLRTSCSPVSGPTRPHRPPRAVASAPPKRPCTTETADPAGPERLLQPETADPAGPEREFHFKKADPAGPERGFQPATGDPVGSAARSGLLYQREPSVAAKQTRCSRRLGLPVA